MNKLCFSQCSVLSCLLLVSTTNANEAKTETSEAELSTVTVVSKAQVADSSKITIDTQTLANNPVDTPQDLFRGLPGITAGSSVSGLMGTFRIRSMGGRASTGDRVTVNIDGVPLASSYSYGHSPFGQSVFDTADLKAIEIIKGASTANGKGRNGLAGTVNFTTKDPIDYIKEDNKLGGNVRLGYNGKNKMKNGGFSIAGKLSESASVMLGYTYRNWHETPNYKGLHVIGSKRTAANPLDANSHNVLTKFVFAPNTDHQFKLKLENYQMDSSQLKLNQSRATIRNYYNTTENKRGAVTLTHDFKTDIGIFDSGQWQAYYQDSDQSQSNEYHSRTYGFTKTQAKYDVKELGLSARFDKQITNHKLAYGFGFRQTDIVSRSVYHSPDYKNTDRRIRAYQYPPDTKTKHYNFWLNDDIAFADDRFHILPGIEFTRFVATPKVTDNYTGSVTETSQSAFSWRLGTTFDINDNHSLFASYRNGLKIPSFAEQNRGGGSAHGGSNYIPNPNLKPEENRSIELGLTSQGDLGSQTVSLFHDTYNHHLTSITIDRANRLYQLTNSDKPVTIYGIEYQGELNLAALGAPEGLRLKGALTYGKAKEKTKNGTQPYTNGDPLNGLIGLAYDAPSKQWGMEWRTHFASAKKAKDIADDDLNPPKNQSWRKISPIPGYGVSDITLYYRPVENMQINGGIYNVFDKRYATWFESMYGDDSYQRATKPGRYFAVDFRYEF